jgi:hypothetical protein
MASAATRSKPHGQMGQHKQICSRQCGVDQRNGRPSRIVAGIAKALPETYLVGVRGVATRGPLWSDELGCATLASDGAALGPPPAALATSRCTDALVACKLLRGLGRGHTGSRPHFVQPVATVALAGVPEFREEPIICVTWARDHQPRVCRTRRGRGGKHEFAQHC